MADKGVPPKRWLGQWPHVMENIHGIDDLADRGRACTELIDTLWHDLLPLLGQERRLVIRQMSAAGLTDGDIADKLGVNRQRISQLRRQ